MSGQFELTAASASSKRKPTVEHARIDGVHRIKMEQSMDHIDTAASPNGAGTIGGRLRDARVSKGYSLEDLAVATVLTEADVSAIEDGTSANARHRERIEHSLS